MADIKEKKMFANIKNETNSVIDSPQFRLVASFLPDKLRREITSLLLTLRLNGASLEEIRLRENGRSSLSFGGKNIPLYTVLGREDFDAVLSKILRDGLYAYRDTMERGYIPLDFGVRCGIVGEISYDGGVPSGVGSISSLVFRLPIAECDFAPEIVRLWRERGGGGLLIASPPLVGKTAALRSLARILASDKEALRVVIVDERGEFYKEGFLGSSVDIMRGYKRRRGVEIAVRTMSAQVIVMDEIGDREDVEAAEYAYCTGVSLVASAHADSCEALMGRKLLRPLFDSGVFSSAALIERRGDGRGFSFFSIKDGTLALESNVGGESRWGTPC